MCVSLYAWVCVREYMCVSLCAWVCVREFVCMSLCAWVCVREYVCVSLCVCICICSSVYACVCEYGCVLLCVYVRNEERTIYKDTDLISYLWYHKFAVYLINKFISIFLTGQFFILKTKSLPRYDSIYYISPHYGVINKVLWKYRVVIETTTRRYRSKLLFIYTNAKR